MVMQEITVKEIRVQLELRETKNYWVRMISANCYFETFIDND